MKAECGFQGGDEGFCLGNPRERTVPSCTDSFRDVPRSGAQHEPAGVHRGSVASTKTVVRPPRFPNEREQATHGGGVRQVGQLVHKGEGWVGVNPPLLRNRNLAIRFEAEIEDYPKSV